MAKEICGRRAGKKLAAADAIIFGSPTYMGSASWQFKKFAEASSKPLVWPCLAGQGVWWLYQQRQPQR
jgi:multimeric flavodoxin WrbA